MKTKQFVFAAVSILISTNICIAQQKNAPGSSQTEMKGTASSALSSSIVAGSGLYFGGNELEGVEGSIYVGENWPGGKLILRGGKTIENYLFRYNVYADQMQFIKDSDTLAFASPGELFSITFDDRTFVYGPYEGSGTLMKGYFELLVPGKQQLLLRRAVSYIIPEETKGKEEPKNKYLISECFFLKKGNLPAQKVICNKKSALNAVGDHQEELDNYLKKTGNKVRTAEDLKRMVAYYNSLE